MRDIFQTRSGRGPLFAVLAAAVLLAAGGGAYAATSSSGSAQQHAARTVSKGPFETARGAFVAAAAVVNSNGTLARGVGVKSSSELGAGAYQVLFQRRVNRCAYEATLGDTGSGAAPIGQIGVATRSHHKNGVFVYTQNSSGLNTPQPFHLVIIC